MILEVISPEKLLFKGEVKHVEMPGINGSFGVLENHAPMISALKKGSVHVNLSGKSVEGVLSKEVNNSDQLSFEISGGVAEIFQNKVIILAE